MSTDPPEGTDAPPEGPEPAGEPGHSSASTFRQSRCAVHPDFAAEAACAYCGTFSCGVCLRDIGEPQNSPKQRVCKSCIDAGHVPSRGRRTPWERRDELGWLQGFWQTIKQVSIEPTSFFDNISTGDRLVEAAVFTFLVAIPGSIVGAAMQFVIGGFSAAIPLLGMQDLLTDHQAVQFLLLTTTGQAIMVLVIGAPMATLLALLWGCIHHLGLILVGGGSRGLETTVKGSLYASAVQFWSVIPLFKVVTNLWTLVVQAVAYCCMHNDPGWKGAFAVLYAMCLCLLAGCGLGVLIALVAPEFGHGLGH